MIRAATHKDIASIIAMSSQFWEHTIYSEPAIDDDVAVMAKHCIDQGVMSVLEIAGKVVGFACAITSPLLANHKVKMGLELAWWVNEDHRSGRNGIGLLRHMEKAAKEAGVKYFNMAYMESSMPEYIKRIYEKMGYTRTEVIYTRVL